MQNNITVIIGGGAAGMLAAAQCANAVLIEKNEKLGKKLYITGKGRCNVTNNCTADELRAAVSRNPKFMYSALSAFPPQSLMRIVEDAGVPLKTERGNRVFPVSDKSSDIIRALASGLKNVKVMLNTTATGIVIKEGAVTGVNTTRGLIPCTRVIVATGGITYPSTGSTGDGYRFAQAAGHTVTPTRQALVPLNASDGYIAGVQGLTLKNVTLTARAGGKIVYSDMGEVLFTHFGISGPLVLSLSSLTDVPPAELELSIDLKPALSFDELNSRLIKDFLAGPKKQLSNVLAKAAPQSILPAVLAQAGLDGAKKVSVLSRAEREAAVKALKGLLVHAVSYRGYEEAVITRGGVSVKEIDARTMESKKVKGLYFAGEVLDVDALTGGFNLQIAFSTGFSAGRAADNIGVEHQ